MTITEKGQITIPQAIREKYRLLPHSAVEFIEEDNKVYIRPASEQPRAMRFSTVRGRADTGMSTEEILSLTRADFSDNTAAEHTSKYTK